MRKKYDVVGAVITQGDLVLAARRNHDQSLPGLWEFPGGKIEVDETPIAALARELQEELLCEAQVGDYITTTSYEYEFATVVLSTYFCTITSGTPRLTEHAEIRWVHIDQLKELEWAPADIPAVEMIPGLLK